MKIKLQYIICFLAGMTLLASCKYDNYSPPSSKLTGAILYKNDSINVSYNNVTFQLWQTGFGKLTPVNVTVDQNGSYSALLFNGDYKLVFPAGQGPFISLIDPKTNSDTMLVHVQGNTNLEIQVLPYYMIINPQFSVSDSTVNATCKLEKIITDSLAQNVQSVSLYLSKTLFDDSRTSVSTTNINGSNIADMNNIALSATIPAMTPTQHYIFARIGVKINNVEDMIFSPVMKLGY